MKYEKEKLVYKKILSPIGRGADGEEKNRETGQKLHSSRSLGYTSGMTDACPGQREQLLRVLWDTLRGQQAGRCVPNWKVISDCEENYGLFLGCSSL